jgi:hypothetical protein
MPLKDVLTLVEGGMNEGFKLQEEQLARLHRHYNLVQ